MNGRTAKAIRRKIYGDNAHRLTRYTMSDKGIICTGYRNLYKRAKRAYKKGITICPK